MYSLLLSVVVSLAVLSRSWAFFVPSHVVVSPSGSLLSSSSTRLHAAALIVQNKGGGHGEIGKLQTQFI
jgi:hypothetical protein